MALAKIFDTLRLPVVAAPMFLVSGKELALACCRAGIVGTFPALNQRSTEGFEQWVVELKEALATFRQEQSGSAPSAPCGPFGVNLSVHRSNPRLLADLEICVKHEVPLVITSLGAVPDLVERVHAYGGTVFHDVTNLKHAQKAVSAGVDGLILVAGGAGGHAGTTNPFALMHEIRPHFEGSLVLAGGLSTGSDVVAARVMGADLAYMGTRFLGTMESSAQDDYKQMLIDARPQDIVHTPAVSGVPANFMRQSLEASNYDMEKLSVPARVNLGDVLADSDGASAWKTVWSAGHGVSAISSIPSVRDLVATLEEEYQCARTAFTSKT
ncbi:MAG: nitronate monooxygenase [Deltaproteobacteria bacterium]|nr:nitronate monooxygenase [Deltaproteobacteria bacterium]